MPFLIFLWLLFLELALAWKKLPTKPLSIAAIVIITVVPTHLISIFAFVLKGEIMELGKLAGTPYLELGQWILESCAMSIEYIILTICFMASIMLLYKIDGLKIFSISTFFIGAISFFYMIDTFYLSELLIGQQALSMFHEYYGELYFIAWVITYLALILYGHRIWANLSALGFKLKHFHFPLENETEICN